MIRPAKRTDAKQLAPLLSIILRDIELPVFAQFNDEALNNKLIPIIEGTESRYSYTNFHVYEREEEILGFLCGYSGGALAQLDAHFKPFLASFNLSETQRLFEDVETVAGEWYIDSLVTAPTARGLGIGTQLLSYANVAAKAAGETQVALNCDQQNPQARALYERLGFKTKGTLMIGDHTYNRMFRLLPLRDDK
ncbi:GNAT family N-acetyltransferase [Brochothrix campestris]|uniref:GNAT family acetyltransferase n=2 Tax=Brochothrix campestris TaxID=2757 RepID=W7CZH1_9LIST|nr:GNAT family N-acetyltransferase [Brochothrix campestris]EUJ41161.1 GNAT family acetyltransferase [Brochothrix campestris FSL F6-1037]